MAFSLARNLGLLRQQGCSSDLLSFAAAISRGNFGQNRCSSTAPVPQESNKNLYGADTAGKYSPFQVRCRNVGSRHNILPNYKCNTNLQNSNILD